MIPQDKNHPGPPGRVTVWGHPWHGLVEAGVLTLPNDATMAYAAPGTAGEADVLAFQPPGTPAVSRTPAQAAADAAAGRQWLDYALISGRFTRRLYGQSIGGNGTWLYAAPDGSRWLVTLADVPGTHDLTAPWDATLTCARFGEFGAPAEEHELSATLADWQQAIEGHAGGDYHVDGAPAGGEVTSAGVTVEDVRRDGSQAVLMIGLNEALGEPIRRNSLGFVTCDLSGTPGVDATAALAVVRTRAQTLGTRAVEIDDGQEMVDTWEASDSIFSGVDDPPPPECGGVWIQTWTAVNPPLTGGPKTYAVGTKTVTNMLSGRILGMLYDNGDTLADITLSAANSSSLTESLTHSSSGQRVNHIPHRGGMMEGGRCNIFPIITGSEVEVEDSWLSIQTITQSYSIDSSLSLSGPGGSVTLNMQAVSNNQTQFTVVGDTESTVSRTYDYSWSLNIGDHHAEDAASGTGTSGLLLIGSTEGFGTCGAGLESTIDGYAAARKSNLGINETITGLPLLETAVGRYSATLAELLLIVDGGSGADARECLGAVGLGIDAAPLAVDADSLYGSAHPVTGEIVRARDVPVCWV